MQRAVGIIGDLLFCADDDISPLPAPILWPFVGADWAVGDHHFCVRGAQLFLQFLGLPTTLHSNNCVFGLSWRQHTPQ